MGGLTLVDHRLPARPLLLLAGTLERDFVPPLTARPRSARRVQKTLRIFMIPTQQIQRASYFSPAYKKTDHFRTRTVTSNQYPLGRLPPGSGRGGGSPRRTLFSHTRDGLAALLTAAAQPRPLLHSFGVDDAFPAKLKDVADVVTAILRAQQTEELVSRLRQIDHDVLGAYFFVRGEVHIYWMVIGFYASILNVSIEDLTIVVVAHELAHVYTHLGKDVDKSRWDTDAFARSDLRIVEGLAQLYTDRVVHRLAPIYPGAETAFHELLRLQSTPYTIFQEWIDAGAQGEEVRATMIQTRKARITTYDEFYTALENARSTAAPGAAEIATPVT
jgi:hypothetical protein